jgi:acyl-CoA thioesterase
MHLFDQDISLKEIEPFRLKGTISDNWSVNGTPNGGYLMALVANAMQKHSNKKSTPIITANYISRCVPGEADFNVELISQSTQFSRLEARLLQDGKEKIRTTGTFADEKNECVLERYETKAPDISSLDACISVPALPKFTLMNNLDIRLDPACAGWMEGKLTDKSEQKGWIKFRDKRPFDMVSIFLIADAFPPPIFATQGLAAWVPTIELSVNVRHIPETEWLKGIFRTRFVTCGLVEEDGEVWDEDGNLVAISRQIAQYRKTSA